jgi:glycolate oxidase FAD binding subunit
MAQKLHYKGYRVGVLCNELNRIEVLVMITANLLTELKSFLPEEQMKENEVQHHLLGNGGMVTFYPRTESEISKLLKFANKNGKKISVVGGGTKRGFGGLVEQADILLSLAQYKGIIEHTPGDMTLTVKAGTAFQEIQDYLAKYHQKISLDPKYPEYSTIGGVIAANESGPKRLGYGSARDAVIGLRIVYPNGEVIRTGGKVVKNVAGYDMNKLFVGSMGTLGVLSEVTLKLRPIAKSEGLILLSFPDGNLEAARVFTTAVLNSMIEPVALELLNRSLSIRLTGEPSYTLAIGLEDVENSVKYQEDFIKNHQPVNTKMTILKNKEAQLFWKKFNKIGPNGASEQPHSTEASLKVGVKNLTIFHVIKESQLLSDAFHVLAEAHGGAGHGLCQVNLNGKKEDIEAAIQHLRNFVQGLGGYVIAKHLPYNLREKVNVWGKEPSYFFLLKGIKGKIDPNQILNYKRFVGGI